MEGVDGDGFHKVQGVRITHGVPTSAGLFRTEERVEVRLPARAINEKQAVNLLVLPFQYSETANKPGVIYVAGRATFWLYKSTVFADLENARTLK